MRFTGKVKWFNESKGYGFIEREDGTDVFVHYTNIAAKGFRTLKENDEVEFEVNEGPKGLQAVNVEKILRLSCTSPAITKGALAPFFYCLITAGLTGLGLKLPLLPDTVLPKIPAPHPGNPRPAW